MAKPLKTALIYDFDGTLARGNMQEVTFIPSVGMGIGDFWGAADKLTREADGDNILMYMQLMLQRARENGDPITRQTLRDHGQDVKLFDGLKSDLTGKGWFERINAFGKRYGLEIEHYIVSAGLEEMIDGCPIRDAFRHVFDRFVRRERGGPGVGLALVKALVELHGGWAEVESEPGKGAAFILHLPLEAAGVAAPPELRLG